MIRRRRERVQDKTSQHIDIGGNYVCHICGRAYMTKKTLIRHIRYECGQEPQFPCPYCRMKYKRRYILRAHIIKRHNNWTVSYTV
ncbi:longitudinals lacking protein, isoforms A/B/D/L-like [Schistocerca nitens]|uniref:longitudinals lacking protein, isoforms A/B/D/L-like n=1 Tax=Schistocerca nitens TaxID=7011 RepID=UPI0021194589|nr:longitudinals lacking protein, isoforms A/B/D/L-like [Schistocerca nitens]